MSDQDQLVVEDGNVVTLDYTLKVDGQIVDTSEGSEPIQFIQGQQHIIPGLEEELYGMSIGETREIVVKPERGYGELDPENYADIPKEQFPPNIPLQPGIQLEVREQDGNTLQARIVTVNDDSVRLDFNHPLAGKELHFNVQVVGLRTATNEEMSHGHVHDLNSGGEHHG